MPPYSGPLDLDTGAPADFFDRQKVVAQYEGHEFAFDAVLEKQGEVLTLVGLTPFGSRAFVVLQRGQAISSQAYVGVTMPFPPRNMLIDVHRVFFSLAPATEPFTSNGERTFSLGPEVVTERWHDGMLLRRSFARADGQPPGTIVVDYGAGMGPEPSSRPHVVLNNGWYGYRLDITTLSHKTL